MRYLAQKQVLNVSVSISKLMLLQWSMSKSENCLSVAISIIIILMSKLSQNVQQRLKAAQQLLKKNKSKNTNSPNFIRIIVNYRKQTLISHLISTQKISKSAPLTELIANNQVKIIQIKRMIRKRLNFQQNESIQLFCNKKLLSDLNKTVKDLRSEANDGSIEIQVTKMQVF